MWSHEWNIHFSLHDIFIHENIPYLLPSSALSQSVLGKIKRGLRPCFHGLNGDWRHETGLSSLIKYIYWPFLGGTDFVFFCLVFVMLSCVCLLMPCCHLLGKGWLLGSRLWCLIVCLSLSHVVSWVRCGTWLYRFLIFALFLTFPSWSSFLYGLLVL